MDTVTSSPSFRSRGSKGVRAPLENMAFTLIMVQSFFMVISLRRLGSVDICVIPVKTGIQNIGMWSLLHILGYLKALDSCFRRNDGGGGLE